MVEASVGGGQDLGHNFKVDEPPFTPEATDPMTDAKDKPVELQVAQTLFAVEQTRGNLRGRKGLGIVGQIFGFFFPPNK